jgi:glutathione S-transferase
MKLIVGSKSYSSWSMRPWVLMRELGIPFEEQVLRLVTTPDSPFKQTLKDLTPVGKVPLLVLDDGMVVWDSLAIVETLHEIFPDHGVWPANPAHRARARSLVAEMHSGFLALRKACPMNIEARLPEVGAQQWAEQEALRADVAALEQRWQAALSVSGGPFLFGAYSAADAFYAPVAARFRSYGLPASAASKAYLDRLWSCTSVQAWVEGAIAEADFIATQEPYRNQRG